MRPFTLLILLLPRAILLPVAKAAEPTRTVLTVVIGAMPLARSTRRS